VYQRHLAKRVKAALQDTPVTLIVGARQSGKSTLAKQASKGLYLTLDDFAVLAPLRQDPYGFLKGFQEPVILDEIQRAPEALLAIKRLVDEDRKAGQFLLTGSANVLLLPKLADSLAGRMEVLRLWPLAQSELQGVRHNLVDKLFGKPLAAKAYSLDLADVCERITRGGYPEAVERRAARRGQWFESYTQTMLERDVRDLTNIQALSEMPQLLRLLAARTSTLHNQSEVSRLLGLPNSSLGRYLTLLSQTFLVHELPAWSKNLSKRLVKAPKLLVSDTGLAAHLLGVEAHRLNRDSKLLGQLLETFVGLELLRHLSWSQTQARLYHFRAQTGQEVDLLLESYGGDIVGVEVKASSQLSGKDLAGLQLLRTELGTTFKAGFIFYTGTTLLPQGDRLWAVPISWLWSAGV
jgi:uncharacterized protein